MLPAAKSPNADRIFSAARHAIRRHREDIRGARHERGDFRDLHALLEPLLVGEVHERRAQRQPPVSDILGDVEEIGRQPRVVADDAVEPSLPVGVSVFRGQAVGHAQQGRPVHASVIEIADEAPADRSVVEITALAREAGHRTKIAVRSLEPGVNAKGACIGELGQRVRAVTAELGNEKIDIVDHSDDLATFVANALSPAKVSSAFVLDPTTKAVRALVPDYQLSLAIGKEGQNARLAAKLTGAKIDIQPDSVMDD